MSRRAFAFMILALSIELLVFAATGYSATANDTMLADALARKLSVGAKIESNVFDAFWVEAHDGVVTVSGYAHNYTAHNDAVAIAKQEKGVTKVVDKIEVLPLSGFDDRIRAEAARRIYGAGGLQRYALDPVHPIRIIVDNGNVILEGQVANSMDRALAEIAADSVPGVFSVTNQIVVRANQKS